VFRNTGNSKAAVGGMTFWISRNHGYSKCHSTQFSIKPGPEIQQIMNRRT
jgi:hypothetical protein